MPFFQIDFGFGEHIVQTVVKDPAWVDIFLADAEKNVYVVESETRDRKIQAKEQLLLSDKPSARNSKASDTHFEALGYRCSYSRYAAHSEEQRQVKEADL